MDTTGRSSVRKYGGLNGYGHNFSRPNRIGALSNGYRLGRMIRANSIITTSFDLSQYAPDVMDQNQTGSCEGHGWSCAIAASSTSNGVPLGYVPSPLGIYQLGRACERIINNLPNTTPLTDSGTITSIVCDAMRMWGIRPTMAPVTLPNGESVNSDCCITTVNLEPELVQLEDCKQLLNEQPILSCLERSGTSAETLAGLVGDLQFAFSQGKAVVFATEVDEAFEDNDGTTVITAPGESLGGHCLCALGGQFVGGNSPENYQLLFQNSWGLLWGKLGRAVADARFIAQASDWTAVPGWGLK